MGQVPRGVPRATLRPQAHRLGGPARVRTRLGAGVTALLAVASAVGPAAGSNAFANDVAANTEELLNGGKVPQTLDHDSAEPAHAPPAPPGHHAPPAPPGQHGAPQGQPQGPPHPRGPPGPPQHGPSSQGDSGAEDNVDHIPTTTTKLTTLSTAFLPGTPTDDELNDLKKSKQMLAFRQWKTEEAYQSSCTSRFSPPSSPPSFATDLNGMQLPDTCFREPKAKDGKHHIFVIGDWGGVLKNGKPTPADHRAKMFRAHHRKFVNGADDVAQLNVAREMRRRAPDSEPDYIINVGDNFYWGGVLVKCGAPMDRPVDAAGQWRHLFEEVYSGPGLDGKQWLGVLGNHDWGGFLFTRGWDQIIAYTWMTEEPSNNRWITPALYYSSRVMYEDFNVDYYFIDSNVFDAHEPHADPGHNLCSIHHNPKEASCGEMGPVSVYECPRWFKKLWDAEMQWLEAGLRSSTADWQIVVTHFPPEHGHDDWKRLTKTYGVDMLIVGHRHQQEVHYMEPSNFLKPTAYIVSGGGGGITSEGVPNEHGLDDQYGFMDLTLTPKEIKIEAISHGGQIRSTHCVTQVSFDGAQEPKPADSMCNGIPVIPVQQGSGGQGQGAMSAPSPAAAMAAAQMQQQQQQQLPPFAQRAPGGAAPIGVAPAPAFGAALPPGGASAAMYKNPGTAPGQYQQPYQPYPVAGGVSQAAPQPYQQGYPATGAAAAATVAQGAPLDPASQPAFLGAPSTTQPQGHQNSGFLGALFR